MASPMVFLGMLREDIGCLSKSYVYSPRDRTTASYHVLETVLIHTTLLLNLYHGLHDTFEVCLTGTMGYRIACPQGGP